jgi:predicted MFS family arabinose efflux permease
VQLWHVYLLAFVLGIFSAIDNPIRQSFNSELVGPEDVPSAVSLNSANFNIGRLLGPALSGFLIEAFGTGPSFLINASSYLAVIVALLAMRQNQLNTPKPAAKGSKIRDAALYIAARPDLFWVMAAVFTTATFGLNFQIFMAIMSTQQFHRQAGDFGLLGTALAVGSLSGALISTRLERHRTPRKSMAWMTAFGLSLTALAFAPTYLAFAFMLPVAGVLALVGIISANSYVQTTTEPTLRGRVMGIYLLIFMGGTPLGSSVLGIAAQQYGIRVTILVCGLITAAAAAFFIAMVTRQRSQRRAQAH